MTKFFVEKLRISAQKPQKERSRRDETPPDLRRQWMRLHNDQLGFAFVCAMRAKSCLISSASPRLRG